MADLLDLYFDRVAVVQKDGWFPGGPYAFWRSSCDKIAGHECHRARRVGCDLGAREDQVCRIAVLNCIAVNTRLDSKSIGIWDFVGSNDPRAERSRVVGVLAECPALTGHLELASAEVVETGIAKETGLGDFGCDVSKLFADDHGQLAFPVEVIVAWWDGDGLTIDCQS